MNPYLLRRLAETAASILILIPCVLLLAWESLLPNIMFFWFVLLVCSGIFLTALVRSERQQGKMTWKHLFYRCGGFFVMFVFILYKFAALL